LAENDRPIIGILSQPTFGALSQVGDVYIPVDSELHVRLTFAMKILVVLFFAFLACACAVSRPMRHPRVLPQVGDNAPAITSDLIATINSNPKSSWTAGENKGSAVYGATMRQARGMMGALKSPRKILPEKTNFDFSTKLPVNFSAITQWPSCSSIGTILDQSACGSCWAFGAKEAIWDRYCIHLNISSTKINVSVDDLVACCDACGMGCGGGFPDAAWDYWVQTGLVTDSCLPYPLPSCDHHLNNSKMPCPSNEYPTPACPQPKKCSDTEVWQSVIHKGKSAYTITQGMNAMMNEIYTNGPVETAFDVYQDFLSYTGGVYKHTTGPLLGGHAVKILGWGVEDNELYWLVANSWNVHWGLNGFFKILRGVNECGFEDTVWGGVPLN